MKRNVFFLLFTISNPSSFMYFSDSLVTLIFCDLYSGKPTYSHDHFPGSNTIERPNAYNITTILYYVYVWRGCLINDRFCL